MEDINFESIEGMDMDLFDFGIDLEPISRSRSNTWPAPVPENFLDNDLLIDNSAKVGSTEHIKTGRSSREGTSRQASECSSCMKKPPRQKNPWGDISYAELITQAINSTDDRRLTLSQIYDWIVKNVPFFKDKSENKSNAGWKNSVRHNLSLHSRFIRIPNESPGKSSWWTINPDPDCEKSTRRRSASLEVGKLEKKKALAKKQANSLRKKLVKNENLSTSDYCTDDVLSNVTNKHLQAPFRSRTTSCASSFGKFRSIPRIPEEQNFMSVEYDVPVKNENMTFVNECTDNDVEFPLVNKHLQASSFEQFSSFSQIPEGQNCTSIEYRELPVNENLTTANDIIANDVNGHSQAFFRSRVLSRASSLGGMSFIPQCLEESNCPSSEHHDPVEQPPINDQSFFVPQNLSEVNNICLLHPVGACTCNKSLEVNNGLANSSGQNSCIYVNENDTHIFNGMPNICTGSKDILQSALRFHEERSNVNYNDYGFIDQVNHTTDICGLPRNNSLLDDINEIIKNDQSIEVEKVNDSISKTLFISNNTSMVNF